MLAAALSHRQADAVAAATVVSPREGLTTLSLLSGTSSDRFSGKCFVSPTESWERSCVDLVMS